jgi:hypothetical protein
MKTDKAEFIDEWYAGIDKPTDEVVASVYALLQPTAKQITELIDINPMNTAWFGETCSKCGKTANICGNFGWICPCGGFNIQAFNFGPMTHVSPDFGPSKKTIRAGIDKSKWWKEQKRVNRRMKLNHILWKLHLKG